MQHSAFFVCRLYGKPKQARDQKDTLTTTGYTNWKRALESFGEHEKSNMHKASVIHWKSFKATQVQEDVTEQLQAANISEIVECREYPTHMAAVTTFLGKQGIAFRGHNETPDSDSKGNFMECMQLLEKFDLLLQTYKQCLCTTYLSPSSQNEMIQSTSDVVISKVISDIKKAKMYLIMVDEARDNHSEQLARLGEREIPWIFEAFDAKFITDTIEQQLEKHGIRHRTYTAQAYDGASVMSGAVRLVQARFREKHPEALCQKETIDLVQAV